MSIENSQNNAIGQRIRKARKNKGFTQERLAGLLDISKKSLENYEKNTTDPTATVLLNIAILCECSAGWLVTGHENNLATDDSEMDEVEEARDSVRSKGGQSEELGENIDKGSGHGQYIVTQKPKDQEPPMSASDKDLLIGLLKKELAEKQARIDELEGKNKSSNQAG